MISIIVTLVTTGGIAALIGIHEWRSFGMVWYGYFQLQNHTLFSTIMDQYVYDIFRLGQQLANCRVRSQLRMAASKFNSDA